MPLLHAVIVVACRCCCCCCMPLLLHAVFVLINSTQLQQKPSYGGFWLQSLMPCLFSLISPLSSLRAFPRGHTVGLYTLGITITMFIFSQGPLYTFPMPRGQDGALPCLFSPRGQTVGLYLTSTPEACYNVATSSQANIIVVENDTQLQKILQVSCRVMALRGLLFSLSVCVLCTDQG